LSHFKYLQNAVSTKLTFIIRLFLKDKIYWAI